MARRADAQRWMMTDQVLLEREKHLAPLWRSLCNDVLGLLQAGGSSAPTLSKVTAVQVATSIWSMLRECCDAESFESQIQAYVNDEDLHPVARDRLMSRATERGVINGFHMRQAEALVGLHERLVALSEPSVSEEEGGSRLRGRLLSLDGGKK